MNFDDTPQEAAFRAQVRAWIDANAPTHLLEALRASGFGGLNLGSLSQWEDLLIARLRAKNAA